MGLRSYVVPLLKVVLIARGAPRTRGPQKEKGQVSRGECDGGHVFPSLGQSVSGAERVSAGWRFFFPPFGPSGPALEGWTAVKCARGRPFSPEWPATGGARPALLGGPQPPFGRPVPRGVGRSDFIPQTPAPHPRLNLRSFCSGDVPKSGASTSQTPLSLLRTANGEHAAADAEGAAAGSKTGFRVPAATSQFLHFRERRRKLSQPNRTAQDFCCRLDVYGPVAHTLWEPASAACREAGPAVTGSGRCLHGRPLGGDGAVQ